MEMYGDFYVFKGYIQSWNVVQGSLKASVRLTKFNGHQEKTLTHIILSDTSWRLRNKMTEEMHFQKINSQEYGFHSHEKPGHIREF